LTFITRVTGRFFGEPLPKHHAEAGRVSFIKAISMLQLSLAFLRELRMALSRRKKPMVPAGS
jgi:hypothetical protein